LTPVPVPLAYMLPKRKLRRKAVLSDFCSY
jgi:hypothetical protein